MSEPTSVSAPTQQSGQTSQGQRRQGRKLPSGDQSSIPETPPSCQEASIGLSKPGRASKRGGGARRTPANSPRPGAPRPGDGGFLAEPQPLQQYHIRRNQHAHQQNAQPGDGRYLLQSDRPTENLSPDALSFKPQVQHKETQNGTSAASYSQQRSGGQPRQIPDHSTKGPRSNDRRDGPSVPSHPVEPLTDPQYMQPEQQRQHRPQRQQPNETTRTKARLGKRQTAKDNVQHQGAKDNVSHQVEGARDIVNHQVEASSTVVSENHNSGQNSHKNENHQRQPKQRKGMSAVKAKVDIRSVSLEEVDSNFTCCICCEPFFAVAVGACDHNEVCARCCLRMRLCYSDNRCPLCKQDNAEVVVIRPEVVSGPVTANTSTFSALRSASHGHGLWTKPKWAKGVFVHSGAEGVQGAHSRGSVPLHISLMQMTSLSCRVCDPVGRRPFPTSKLLQEHLSHVHGLQHCRTCMAAGTQFTLELDVFTPEALNPHMRVSHPRCEFCDEYFYGLDEQYKHMNERHYSCHICQRQGAQHIYHQNAWDLRAHLGQQHYLCEEADCADCLISFATEEELKHHYVQRHSRSMPRWDNSRSRPLVLDLGFGSVRASFNPETSGSGRSEGRTRGMEGGRGRDRRRGGSAVAEFSSVSQEGAVPIRSSARELADMADTEGGLAIIDDDLGLGSFPPAISASTTSAGAGSRAMGGRGSGAWARPRNPADVLEEDFPSLAAAAAPGPGSRSGPWSVAQSQQQTSTSGTQLCKATSRCPCGRRIEHSLLRSNEQPPALSCDRNCEAQRRRFQLADAFSVSDPNHHVSYFERHRTPDYSTSLLQAAQDNLHWVEHIEQQLANFVMDASSRRTSLAAMNRQQRGLVHEIADQGYGLTSVSTGSEPNRFIQLFKNAASGMPTRLLSVAATALSREDLTQEAARQAQALQQLTLRVLDIAPGTNLHYFFREWSGEFNLTEQAGGSEATVVFSKESVIKACLGVLGGGVRGVFRIERLPPPSQEVRMAARPSTAAAALAAPAVPKVSSRSNDSSVALAPTDRWLVVKKGGSKRNPAARDSSGSVPYVDPWADSQAPPGPSALSPALVADDWEHAQDQPIGLKQEKPLKLEDGNMWQALDHLGAEGAVEEQRADLGESGLGSGV